MNHQKVYDSIIQKAKSENRKKLKKTDDKYVYYENHHILPKCLNGSNDKENLVLLTAREHYICHKLLTYIYKRNRSIACAFFRMVYDKKGRTVSSRDYTYAKELKSIIPISDETKLKIKLHNIGKIRSEKARKNYSAAKKGLKLSDEHKQKIAIAHIGKIYGPMSNEHKENISKSKKGIHNTEEHNKNIKKGWIKRKQNKNFKLL